MKGVLKPAGAIALTTAAPDSTFLLIRWEAVVHAALFAWCHIFKSEEPQNAKGTTIQRDMTQTHIRTAAVVDVSVIASDEGCVNNFFDAEYCKLVSFWFLRIFHGRLWCHPPHRWSVMHSIRLCRCPQKCLGLRIDQDPFPLKTLLSSCWHDSTWESRSYLLNTVGVRVLFVV